MHTCPLPAAIFPAVLTPLLPTFPPRLQERLQSLAPCITWDCLQTKLEQHPSLFEVAVWPVLSAQGWTISTNTPANGSSPNSGSSSSNPAAFTPPAAVTAAFHASTGAEAGAPASPTLSCSCPADVLAVLSASKAAVPEQVVAALRQAESAGRVAAMLAEAAAAAARDDDAPHRVCADPSGKLAGLPTSKRHLVRLVASAQDSVSSICMQQLDSKEDGKCPTTNQCPCCCCCCCP